MIKNLLLATGFALAPLQTTQQIIETYTQNTITYNYTGSNVQYTGTDAKYSYYNEDKYIDVGPLKFRAKLIIVNSFSNVNNRTAINLNYFLMIEVKNPEGYIYQGNITTNGNTNFQTNDFTEITYGYLDQYDENAGYDVEPLEYLMYRNYNTVENIFTQIENLRDYVANDGAGWDEQYHTIVKTEQNYSNFNSYIQDLNERNKTIPIENQEAENTEPEVYLETAQIYTEVDFLLDYQRQNFDRMLDNILDSTTIQIKFIGPNVNPTVEVIDIPGLIFTILGMPFAWFSTAFDITLFPGTPYSVNIALLLIGIIGLLLTIFIIKKILK